MKKSKELPIQISIEKAKSNKLFYFVVTGTIYHPEKKKCLILQRSVKEITHPGLWGVVGGKLEWQDLEDNPPTRQNFDVTDWEGLVEKLLVREAKEEASLKIGDFKYLDSVVFIRPDKVPAVCIKLAAKYLSGQVKIAPEFDSFAWVDSQEVKSYQTIQGIDKEVAKTISLYE